MYYQVSTLSVHIMASINISNPKIPLLTPCIQETPKQVLLQTVKTQMKCSIKLHFIRVYTVCLFDLILYVPSTIFQLNGDGSSWVEPVLS